MSTNTSPWKPRTGLKPLRKVYEKFVDNGINFPHIPKKLQWKVQRGVGDWMMFTTNPKLSPWLPYSLYDLYGHDQLQTDFRDVEEDFIICGVNGHGVNSYGLGLIARVGNLFIAQQAGYGGAYSDEKADRLRVNAQMATWNETLREINKYPDVDDPTYLVEFSNFRLIAKVWRKLPVEECTAIEQQGPDAWQENWELLVELSGFVSDESPYLPELLWRGDFTESCAVQHLIALAKHYPHLAEQVADLEFQYSRSVNGISESEFEDELDSLE